MCASRSRSRRSDSARIPAGGYGTCSSAITSTEVRRPETYARESAVYALPATSMEELIAIDDIELPDEGEDVD